MWKGQRKFLGEGTHANGLYTKGHCPEWMGRQERRCWPETVLPHRCYTASTKSLSTPSLRCLMRASLPSVEEDPDMPGKEGDLENDIQSPRNVPTVR